MHKKIETVSAVILAVLLISFYGYVGWWLYDCFYGDRQYVPIVVAAPELPRPTTYQVMPGDSLWSIYVTYYKGCDWDEVRYKIGQANGLKNDRLYPYEVIKLPEVG